MRARLPSRPRRSSTCHPRRVPVRVEIEVLQPLAFLAGAAGAGGGARWEYRFPTVVGVRYEGEPGRVPDAGKLDVDRSDAAGTPARLEVDLLVADGVPETTAPESSSHALDLRAAEGATKVALASPSRLDRDLV